MYSLSPIAHRILRRLHMVGALDDQADEVVSVHEEERQAVRPAFFLEGQLDRVVGVYEWSTFEHERSRALGEHQQHAATLALRFDRARLLNGVVYVKGARLEQVFEREHLAPQKVTDRVSDVVLPSSVIGNRYFGHFITEDCCAMLLAPRFGEGHFTGKQEGRSEHELRYLEIYGLPRRELRNAEIDRLWLFQDFGMNRNKRERLSALRQKVRSHAKPGRGSERVFFRRRGAGEPRGCLNEPELERRLEAEGFDIIDVTQSTVDEILERSLDAKVICGVEGSALVHGMLAMGDDAALLCIQPPARFNVCLKDHVDGLGLSYGFVVGTPRDGGFVVDADEVLRTADLATGAPR